MRAFRRFGDSRATVVPPGSNHWTLVRLYYSCSERRVQILGAIPSSTARLFAGSKLQLQRQLRRPRAADLIQRIEASILAAAAERGAQHLCRLAEQRRGHVVSRRSEVGVVEDVKQIRARLKR